MLRRVSGMLNRSMLRLAHQQTFNNSYVTEMYKAWQTDKNSVSEQWSQYFKNYKPAVDKQSNIKDVDSIKEKSLALEAFQLIRYYELRGHELAAIDPLSLQNYSEFGKIYRHQMKELDVKNTHSEAEIDTPFRFPSHPTISKRISGFLYEKERWTLRELQQRLSILYSGKISLEYMHIVNEQEKLWLMNKFETLAVNKISNERKLKILEYLNKIEVFNSFLSDRLKTSKRFGVEGCDTIISGLNALVDEAARHKVQYIGFGMAHRGRLNALANVFRKPLQKIFAEFQEHDSDVDVNSWGNSGDVKYHLGATENRTIDGHRIKLCVLANPSHLETVNGVVMGNVRAVRDYFKDDEGSKTMGVLIHGDAALAGQGICYESLSMVKLNHFKISGVIHIVANNQIGFTTTPAEARTGLYCTDVAKSIMAPIIHVNADEPELVDQAMSLAVQYRQKFKSDIFVDVIGYRRYGHNEQDQPSFTQPMMYQKINQHRPIYHIYADKLVADGVITKDQKKKLWDEELNQVKQSYNESRSENFNIKKWSHASFQRVDKLSQLGDIKDTGVAPKNLHELGTRIYTIPQGFNVHPMIKKIYDQRKESLQTGKGIDFATAESLAFATLLKEGFNVRFSGQDVERGTFSHRHAVLVDQKTNEKYIPLRSLLSEKDYKNFQIENSLLSQYAVLGYEYGYSITNPNTLTIWEAQFGDFANGAQIVIDNYLSSGESKWGVESGLVMNLPHGMDGQGPEHSSARTERFLQLMSEDLASVAQGRKPRGKRQILNSNMQIINCSFAANYFHALRRQLRRQFRKPLINLFSKKLLKFKPAMSSYDMFEAGNRFFPVMPETESQTLLPPAEISKVIIVSGQAYYSLAEKRAELKHREVAIVRLEQLAPFPFEFFKKILSPYVNAKFVWFQEEHKNSGGWTYVEPRIQLILDELKKEGVIRNNWIDQVSRKSSASPAVGKKSRHDQEQAHILAEVFKQ